MQYMAKNEIHSTLLSMAQFATDLPGSCEVPGQAIAAVRQVLDV